MENYASNYSAALMLAALRQGKLSSLSETLKIIAEAANSYGCILWQEVPGLGSGTNIPSKYLFVLADWFEDNKRYALHNLPLNSSATGYAVLNKTIINIPDIPTDNRIFNEQSFLHRFDVKSMCSIPIQFLDSTSGAVNLYRKTPGPLNTDELAQIEQLASLIPDLYQAIRDKVSLNLIESINERLHDAELSPSDTFPSKEYMKEVIQTICSLVADSFQCLETSIFLENRLEAPQTYELMATTWDKPFKKAHYKKSIREGLTGWALAHAKTVRIFDLAQLKEIGKLYVKNTRELTGKIHWVLEQPSVLQLI